MVLYMEWDVLLDIPTLLVIICGVLLADVRFQFASIGRMITRAIVPLNSLCDPFHCCNIYAVRTGEKEREMGKDGKRE